LFSLREFLTYGGEIEIMEGGEFIVTFVEYEPIEQLFSEIALI